jgi:hypothetical protein
VNKTVSLIRKEEEEEEEEVFIERNERDCPNKWSH